MTTQKIKTRLEEILDERKEIFSSTDNYILVAPLYDKVHIITPRGHLIIDAKSMKYHLISPSDKEEDFFEGHKKVWYEEYVQTSQRYSNGGKAFPWLSLENVSNIPNSLKNHLGEFIVTNRLMERIREGGDAVNKFIDENIKRYIDQGFNIVFNKKEIEYLILCLYETARPIYFRKSRRLEGITIEDTEEAIKSLLVRK